MKIAGKYSQVSYSKATAKCVPRGVFRRNVRGRASGIDVDELCCAALHKILLYLIIRMVMSWIYGVLWGKTEVFY
jgi:hypothetical protein